MRALLVGNGVISEKDVQCQIEYQEARTPANRAKLVVNARVDPAFKARLIADPKAACSEMGIDATAVTEFVVLENTSNYAIWWFVLYVTAIPGRSLADHGIATRAPTYSQRSVSDPCGVMREFGLPLPDDVEVRVYDSTADIRYIVMP